MCLEYWAALHLPYSFEAVARMKIPILQMRELRPAATAPRSHSYLVIAQFTTWDA